MKSLYIHIPFCKQKCLYCDFNSYSGKEDFIEKYISALKQEMQRYHCSLLNNNLEFTENKGHYHTVYFGGGTPSIIPAKYIKEIMEMITCNGEITLELNPGTIDEEKLKIYKEAGINRLSIGLQATQDSILKTIGRIHTFEEFDKAFKMAKKAGFNNINVDLMFGLPNQTLKDVEESLQYVIRINPEHISCYSLILHNNIFENLPSEEEERQMYYFIMQKLKEAGYEQYEISNFAKLGKESKHNLCYWNQNEYIGVGAGASSYIDGKRYTNELNIERYIEKINANEQWYEMEEIQDAESKIREYMILRLRLLEGVNVEETYEKFDVDVCEKFEKEINKMVKKGLLEIAYDKAVKHIRLTSKGLDFANIVWEEFI